MSLPVNDTLFAGRYELQGIIGLGGMAEVHRARDTVLGRPVAIKLFAPHADLDTGRRFENEVRTLARLSHPGLVAIHDAGTSGRTPFVVLQLVEGHTLHDHVAEGALSADEVRRLGAALADALAHVHDHGLVHRDVKPSNILLDDAGTPYLADFGLAHLVGSTRLTRADQMVGTPAYLAPEQARGAEIDHAVDVYALGLVLLECLTGRREYPGGDVESAVARLHRPPVIPGDLPPELARLLALMTAESPHDRPTARRCAHVLRTGAFPVDRTVTVDFVPPTDASSRTRSRKALVASVAGLVGAIGLAWAVAPDSAPPASEPVRQAVVHATTTTPVPTVQPTVQPSADPPATTVTAPAVAQQPVTPDVRPAPVPEQAAVQGESPGQGKNGKAVRPGKVKKGKP